MLSIMYNDVAALQYFYTTPLGVRVRDTIAGVLCAYYPSRPDERVMGLGFVLPYLEGFREHAERCFVMMLASQGAQVWPHAKKVASCLVFAENLPLPDSCLDRIVLVHALEHVENAMETLRELWRILLPRGQVIMVVTNRHGPWANADSTPFGNGEPYSRAQLTQILKVSGFDVLAINEALHLWPYKNEKIGQFSAVYEKIVGRFIPWLGGVLIVHAQKQMNEAKSVRCRQLSRSFVPALMPQAGYPRLSS